MKARQNRLARINSGIEGLVDKLFSFVAPSPVQPTDIARKLESAMEDGSLHEKAGHWLAPNVYDVNLSTKDHQRLSPGEATLVRGWKESLIVFAKKKHYTLKTDPVIRLHGSTKIRLGLIQVEAKLEDARNMGSETISSAGISETQQLDPAQLALLRAQLPPGQPLPGVNKAGTPSPSRNWSPAANHPNQPSQSPAIPAIQPSMSAPSMPWAQLLITIPQGGQRTFMIDKPEVNIGRQLSNDIIVEDKRVSRDHAKIVYAPDGRFYIMDLSSTNGINLNGMPLTGKGSKHQRVLNNGDRFIIGSYDFYFERR